MWKWKVSHDWTKDWEMESLEGQCVGGTKGWMWFQPCSHWEGLGPQSRSIHQEVRSVCQTWRHWWECPRKPVLSINWSTTAWTTNEWIIHLFLIHWNSMIKLLNVVCTCTFSNRQISFNLKPNKHTQRLYLHEVQWWQFPLKRKKKMVFVFWPFYTKVRPKRQIPH